jgi:hypothetical protein
MQGIVIYPSSHAGEKMGASWIKCSACGKEVVASEGPFVCVEVKDRTCVTVAVEAMNDSIAEVICLVHEECLEKFEELVAAGVYSGLNSN